MTQRILIVDDEANYRRVLKMMLAALPDVELTEAEDGEAALACVEQSGADLVITDVNMPRMNGLLLLARLKELPEPPAVVVITAHSSIDDAVDAIQRGAIDYLTKPFEEARLLLTVKRALAVTQLVQENTRLRDDVKERHAFSAIKGNSPALEHAKKLATKMAQADSPVLIVGESGSGKELFARAIHLHSQRASGPFSALNCAAIPEGLLEAELFGAEQGAYTGATKKRRGRVELARGGTLFLDEIGDMPLALQAKLLRLVQERTFSPLGAEKEQRADVRFVFATHRDLGKMVKEGTFREDLRFRVSVLMLELPPLRLRGDDVLLLADATVERVCREMGRRVMAFSDAAKRALGAHSWPGNVRELSNVVERAVILAEGDVLDAADLDLPTAVAPSAEAPPDRSGFALPEGGLSLDALERSLVEQALVRTKGNKSQAARLLGLTRATLRYRIDKMGLEAGADDDA